MSTTQAEAWPTKEQLATRRRNYLEVAAQQVESLVQPPSLGERMVFTAVLRYRTTGAERKQLRTQIRVAVRNYGYLAVVRFPMLTRRMTVKLRWIVPMLP